MRKATLAVAAAALSFSIICPAVRAADDGAVAPQTGSIIQTSTIPDEQLTDATSNAPFANSAQQTLGNIFDMSGFLMGEMPPPDKRMLVQDKDQPDERIALGGAPDAVPPIEGHLGAGGQGMGKDGAMCGPGKAMAGCPMMAHKHNWCPLVKLEGQYALTDDQYQKLYDIKGQFIANIVPKGLNAYMLIRKMGDMLTAAEPDSQAVKSLEKQIAGNVAELSMTVMDSVVSADQVLTPDQRKELHRKMIRH